MILQQSPKLKNNKIHNPKLWFTFENKGHYELYPKVVLCVNHGPSIDLLKDTLITNSENNAGKMKKPNQVD